MKEEAFYICNECIMMIQTNDYETLSRINRNE